MYSWLGSYIYGLRYWCCFDGVGVFSRLLKLRRAFNMPGGDPVKLDALWCKALVSFVKAKVRKGQGAMEPCARFTLMFF